MHETLPGLLARQARERGSEVAFREKNLGIWQPTTWAGYLERVRRFALGLLDLGLERGDRVAILGDNRPEWVIAELAVQAAGAWPMGLYQDSGAEEVFFLLEFSGARFVVAEDQEQVDKILEIRERLPLLVRLIYADPRGLRAYEEPILLEFPAVEELGRAWESERPGAFEGLLDRLCPEDTALLATTSGTTGKPKLAVLSHVNLLSAARALATTEAMRPGEELVSFLPLAWIGEQMLSVSCSLVVGLAVNFPEEPETVRQDLVEIGPHTLFSPPRIWENMVSEVQVRIEDASRLRRLVCAWAFRVGEALEERRRSSRPIPWSLRLGRFWAEWLCFYWIKDQLGLRRLERAYTGGAALGSDVFRFFRALGVPMKQIYGQTEVAGISVVHRQGDVKFQTVGRPLPHMEVRIAAGGEILTRGGAVFQGYYENPEATAETFVDAWLKTGDAGYFDNDGHLVVIDRIKDVTTLEDGTVLSPQFLENKLKWSPYVKEAVVFERGWVAAMLIVDFANAGKWAENRQIPYTTLTDLAQREEIYGLVAEHVKNANRDVPRATRVRRFLLLHKELDADEAELTRTRKVRRSFVAERYGELVEALFGTDDAVVIRSEIVYQDGRTSEIETTLRIATL